VSTSCRRSGSALALLSLGAAFAAGTVAVHREIDLADGEVMLAAEPDQVLDGLRDTWSQGPDVVARSANGVVRRFRGSAGRFRYESIERVEFEAGAVTFEHLRGPFRSCRERIEVTPSGDGSRLTHSGAFAMRGGLAGWVLGRTMVKQSFERHVREHLGQMVTNVRRAEGQAR